MGFGNGSPTNRGSDYRAIPRSKGAVEVSAPKYGNSDEMKLAKSLIKVMNVSAFDFPAFAYFFVMHAPGPVIKNTLRLLDSILDVLAERLDNDLCSDGDEYNAAVTAKRIQEALERYK